MDALPDLHQLWVDYGRPGAHKFRQILLRKGIAAPSEKYLNEHFMKYQSSKQVFARPRPTEAKYGRPVLTNGGRLTS